MSVVLSTPVGWSCETTGKVTWYTHLETDIQVSILELYGSVPRTARPKAWPTDDPVYVVRKHYSRDDQPQHIATVEYADAAKEEAAQTMMEGP